jgi:hypothetical protein
MEESAIKRRHREIMERFGKDLCDMSVPMAIVRRANSALFFILYIGPVDYTRARTLSAGLAALVILAIFGFVLLSIEFFILNTRYWLQIGKMKSQLFTLKLQPNEGGEDNSAKNIFSRDVKIGPTSAEVISLVPLLPVGFFWVLRLVSIFWLKLEESNPISYAWALLVSALVLIQFIAVVHYWWKARPMIRDLRKAQHLPSACLSLEALRL